MTCFAAPLSDGTRNELGPEVEPNATATPTTFVCAPPERRYDTPLGRLIQLAPSSIADLGPITGHPPKGNIGSVVAGVTWRARRLSRNPKLTRVRRIRPELLRHLDEIVAHVPAHSS